MNNGTEKGAAAPHYHPPHIEMQDLGGGAPGSPGRGHAVMVVADDQDLGDIQIDPVVPLTPERADGGEFDAPARDPMATPEVGANIKSGLLVGGDSSGGAGATGNGGDGLARTSGGGSATLTSTIINLIKTTIGSGILSLPFAFAQTGFLLGAGLLVVCGIAQAYALHLMALVIKKTRLTSPSFRSIASVTYGPRSRVPKAVAISVSLACFLFSTSFLIVIGDLMPDIVEFFRKDEAEAAATGAPTMAPTCADPDAPFDLVANRRFWITVLGAGTGLPLMLARDLSSLKIVSMIGNVAIVYIVIICALFASGAVVTPQLSDAEKAKLPPDSVAGAMSVPALFIAAFCCTQNMPALVSELENNTMRRIDKFIVARRRPFAPNAPERSRVRESPAFHAHSSRMEISQDAYIYSAIVSCLMTGRHGLLRGRVHRHRRRGVRGVRHGGARRPARVVPEHFDRAHRAHRDRAQRGGLVSAVHAPDAQVAVPDPVEQGRERDPAKDARLFKRCHRLCLRGSSNRKSLP